MLRLDEYWIADKKCNSIDKVEGQTKMRSLSEYAIHNTIKIEHGYLQGRYGGVPHVKLEGTTPEEFRRRPHSEPINEKIAGALFKGGKAEGWGRGILNIYTLCKDAGMPEPEYDFVTNFVCLTIRFKTPLRPYVSGEGVNEGVNGYVNGGVNGGVNEGVKTLTPSQKRVYDVVHDNPGLNTKQIADILNKSPRTVEKHLTFLRTKSLIVHKDSDKTGGYYPL